MVRRSPSRRVAGRMPPDARRRQLVAEAAQILTDQGLEQLQITEVAERAGVSRPLVYRLFPTRQALLRAVLEDFVARVGERFQRALLRAMPGTIEHTVTAFIDASCDAIADKGAGPWLLLDARGADPTLTRVGRTVFAALLGPWQEQLAVFLGVPPRRAANVLWVIVAAGRTALDGWIDGTLSRAEAVGDATRAVTALLLAFSAKAAMTTTTMLMPASPPIANAKPPAASPRRRRRPRS
jgi:AcrR family transcriptional regulator